MVYIDRPRVRQGKLCCHMVADTRQELGVFARFLGINSPVQKARRHPHYDLFGQLKIDMAIKHGAKLVGDKELVVISHSLIVNNKKSKSNGYEEINCFKNSS